MDLWNEIKNFFGSEENEENNELLKKILIMGIVGLILIFAGNIFSLTEQQNNKSEVEKEPQKSSVKRDYVEQLTLDLEELINLIEGVGKVEIELKTDQSMSYEYEYKSREDNKITKEKEENSGEREIEESTVDRELNIVRDGNGNEEAVVKTRHNPEITGVLIVAQGAENSRIRYQIYQAVSDFLELPIHKINVLPHERS
ncbi:MAG: hypothetical protein ACOC4G_10370 [Bacillota bacterium]